MSRPVLNAHALGGWHGMTYVNSYDAYLTSYRSGFRNFEVDIACAADGVYVVQHASREQEAFTSNEFLAGRVWKRKKMLLDDIWSLMRRHSDVVMMFDFQPCLFDRNNPKEMARFLSQIPNDLKARSIVETYSIENTLPILQCQGVKAIMGWMPPEITERKDLLPPPQPIYKLRDCVNWCQLNGVRRISVPFTYLRNHPSEAAYIKHRGLILFSCGGARYGDIVTADDLGIDVLTVDFLIPGGRLANEIAWYRRKFWRTVHRCIESFGGGKMNRSQLKPMSIVEIQQVQLECVKQIHNFCRKKNLTYFLAYGSLIGAVRHRGPIPWDDDIDVYMPRPDYERFVQEYPDSAVYRVFSPMKRNSLQLFSRLCEMRATCVKTWAKWADSETGVWVDVLPLDAVSSDDVVHEKRMSQIDYLWHRLASSRLRLSYIFSRDFHGGLRSRIKAFLKVLIYSPLRKKWLSEAMQIMRAEDWQRSALVGNYADRDGRDKMQMPKEWFAKQVLLPYADTELNAPFGWDAYLKHYFGDYMTPPPVDKRAKHAGWQTAYWKV